MPRRNELTQAVDKIVGERINVLRLTKGLSLEQLASKIGVKHQQLHKYESASNRVSAGRLAAIARALKKPISYFFDEEDIEILSQHQRMAIEVSRNFLKIKNPAHQIAVSDLISTLAGE